MEAQISLKIPWHINFRFKQHQIFAGNSQFTDSNALQVNKLIIHPHIVVGQPFNDNDDKWFHNDLCIIVMNEKFNFGNTIQKAVLANQDDHLIDVETTLIGVAGYGRFLGKTNEQTKALRARTTILKYYAGSRLVYTSIGSMKGDNGGPVFRRDLFNLVWGIQLNHNNSVQEDDNVWNRRAIRLMTWTCSCTICFSPGTHTCSA